MAEAVYLLCGITSATCAALLFKGYRANPTSLLLYASISFVGFALNNALLFIDLVVVPEVDLSVLRSSVALAAMLVLLYGLIFETQ
jgi:hypothetical protein